MRRTIAAFVLSAAVSSFTAALAAPPASADPLPPGYCVEAKPPWPDDHAPWVRVCEPW